MLFRSQNIGRALVENLPASELVMLEGVGHAVFADAPERCAEAMLRFRDRLNSRPAG